MGKKPVVALVGLVWAGMALTGCGESCRNCRNKYKETSTFQTRNTTKDPNAPAPTIADVKSGQSVLVGGAKTPDLTAKNVLVRAG